MGLLGNAYSKAVSNSKHADRFVSARTPIGYPTGVDLFDYMNGKWVTVKGDKGYTSLGFDEGSYVMLVGRSGTSKTCFAIQAGWNIVKDFDEGMLYIDDIEAATDEVRIKNITRMSDEEFEEKVRHRNTGITCESFYENISMIYNSKMEIVKDHPEFLVHTGKKDMNGNEIITLPPTVYILDSIALLVPENLSKEEEVSGQMSTTSSAKMNAKVFRQIIPKLKKANIILIAINHLTTKIEMIGLLKMLIAEIISIQYYRFNDYRTVNN